MKKLAISLSVVALVGSALAFSSFATDEQTDIFRSLKAELMDINATKEMSLAQVENEDITNKEFQIYKAYMNANLKLNNIQGKLSDSELLKDLVIDKLLVQEAENQGVAVSLKDAEVHSQEMRKILENTDDEKAKDFQKNVIEVTGLSEEEYWKKHAPNAYRNQLSIENLIEKLVQDGVLPNATEDPDSFDKAYRNYKEDLYESHSKNVKIFTDEIQLKD
ncbi:hypothetical protein KDJ56_16985 [Brevibacillus composti]|uniref:SurA-like protein n=1 Tax=Brevibacillus composti TaxID=2796470 RepID=A0A7T5EJA4_9BACL|nr:hypothetical protein [Brevibacillus composti]QQE73580.1 hypothetical protein JD108_17040 [Brevibacillus composti]QUO40662.1 hypothetical protein KDJ56_16985 [Brevibacillus composti]